MHQIERSISNRDHIIVKHAMINGGGMLLGVDASVVGNAVQRCDRLTGFKGLPCWIARRTPSDAAGVRSEHKEMYARMFTASATRCGEPRVICCTFVAPRCRRA